jgi:uncharacterized DUF497 family protein
LEHSESEERWFSVGSASSGAILSVFYLWSESDSVTTIRLYSARKATRSEAQRYQEML